LDGSSKRLQTPQLPPSRLHQPQAEQLRQTRQPDDPVQVPFANAWAALPLAAADEVAVVGLPGPAKAKAMDAKTTAKQATDVMAGRIGRGPLE
jgi:hypothetical protein